MFLSSSRLADSIHVLVVSKVDYCNSVMTGIPSHLMDELQSVLNSPRDKHVFVAEPRFFIFSNFFAVSSRFLGAEFKSDECQTGTLEHFRQNPKIQDGRRPSWEIY